MAGDPVQPHFRLALPYSDIYMYLMPMTFPRNFEIHFLQRTAGVASNLRHGPHMEPNCF